MSKRFGRNQKRRMRRAIEIFEKQRTQDQHAIDNLKDRVDSHREFFEYVLDIVGPNSVINPEPAGVEFGADYDMRTAVYTEPINPWSDTSIAKAQTTVVHALHTAAVKDKLRGAMHFRVRLRNGEVRYALTDEAIAALPKHVLERVLHREITRQMAHCLAAELKG